MIKRGQRFIHSRQITRDNQPMECTITRVTAVTVYFVNETGFKSRLPRAKFEEAVAQWVDTTAETG